MSKETCLNIRLSGNTAHQIEKAAKDMGLCIRRIWKKDKGGYYGYGNTIKRYEETPND